MNQPQPHLRPESLRPDPQEPTELDGRRQRRDRNRNAVVDAMLDLHREGNLSPSVAEIADRSGVSHRSVFRYFDDLDDLVRVACERSAERFHELAIIHRFGEGTLEERVDRLIQQRLDLFEDAGPTGRAGRLKAPFMKVMREHLKRTRALQRDQLRLQFAPELKALSQDEADMVLAAVDVATSLESYDLLRDDQGMSKAKTAKVLRHCLLKLLSPS